MEERSILADLRPPVTFALRAAPHLMIALFGSPAAPRWRRLGTAAGALAGDVALRRWLEARPDVPPGPGRILLDTVESAVWTRAAGPHERLASLLQNAHVMPAGLEAGFRLGAGVEAVPVVRPERPFPPPRPRARALARGLVPVALPFAAHALVRHRQGRPWNWIEPVFATLGSFGLARHRDRLQREARRRWWDRARTLIATEAERAAAGAALRPSPGHDFKKTLAALAWAGSEPARAAVGEQMARPRLVAQAVEGSTLMMTVPGVPIEPWAACDTWLDPAAQRRLVAHLDEVDTVLQDRSPPPLIEVEAGEDGPGLRLRYRGRPLALHPSLPSLDRSLDAVQVAIGVGITFKFISSVDGARRVPLWVTGPAALLDVAVLVAHGRHRVAQRPERFRRAAVASTASAIAFMVAVQTVAPAPEGVEEFPASLGAMAVLGVLGTCDQQLGRPLALALAGATGATWLALLRRGGRWPASAPFEAAYLWVTYAGSRGLTTRVAAEAASVEAGLRQQFAARVQQARAAAASAELERFRRQLALAEREVEVMGDAMDPELVAFVRQECQELRAWIAGPDAPPPVPGGGPAR